MDHHGNESTSRRSLFNGLVTVATRSWRHGQPNGHTSNAMVFPTITTAVNTSPTCRVPPTNSSTIAEEQSRRLQQQRHQDHRLNVLWYGGDDSHQQQQQQLAPALGFESHNRFQSTDEWEKQPLRQQRQKSHHTRCRRNHKKKKHVLPIVPVIWAALLQAAYSIAMAIVYCIYNITTGSGWIWLRGIADESDGFYWWFNHLSPTWYYTAQASCAVVIGYFWYRWFCLRQQQRQQWCCFMLLVLFITALLPSIPLTEIFAGSSKTVATSLHRLENSTTKQLQKSTDYFKPQNFDDNRLALYEGLWQVVFFIFVAYCLVLPTSVRGIQNNENDENTNNNRNNNTKNNENNINKDHITTAVLLFTIIASVGHTVINALIAYYWCWRHHYHKDGLISSSSAIKQLIANIVILTCINLIGWLLRRSLIKDRIEIQSLNDNGRLYRKHKQLRFALRRQAEKLNLLLASILPKRVFSEMKYDIVVDAARSYNVVFGSNNNNKIESHLKQTWQELQLQTPRLPRMYLKEYENVSVVCANLTGFWDNVLAVSWPGESGSQQSSKFITLIDRLLGDLFHKLARRNHCLPISIHGHRMIFVAGLPPEEGYGYSEDEYKVVKGDRHARNAIRLGLDLINSVNVVVNDVSRYRYGHKINLNVRVGVHSGRITSGVLGFTGGTSLCFESGNRWQYEMWGPDVTIASDIESSGRSGWVHVSRTTFDQITKDVVTGNTLVAGSNQPPPGVILRQNNQNYSLDGYTFERGNSYNCIETYFVVPSKMCSNSALNGNSMMSQKDVQNNDGTNNHFGEDIESLILQSVECQLEKEDSLQCIIDSAPEAEMTTEHLLSTSTTAVVEVPVIPAAPVTSVKMIMNRHRRSRYYEQDPLQSVATKVNTKSALTTTMERFTRWEDNVFRGYDNDDNDKLRSKSDDDDLFRLAKSQLLLLCLIITLFVVNVTTMSWTMLLGITFITPFVVTAGELIYVMALLIDWIPRPRFLSTTYTASIIADDYEYYHHYDSDNNDSDCSISSDSSGGCLRRLLICHGPGSCSFLALLLKPFRQESNTVTTTRRSPPEDSNRQCWFFSKWCRCYHCHGSHGWFTGCIDTDDTVSWISSEDSDIESRLGFRNENAIMAASVGASQPQQLLNRSQHSQPNNIRSSHRSSQFYGRQKRKYQVEGRRSWFFWLVACSEIFVVLLVCLLALLNAFTCEPVAVTSTNTIFNNYDTRNNNSSGYKTSTFNATPIQQQHLGPLICPWPQYVVLTCCLACLSIAVAFPIYYGSLPTMPMKIGTLLVMIFVFAIAFVHFTHRHVFNAASMLSLKQSCCVGEDLSNRLMNNTIIMSKDNHPETRKIVRRDLYQENRQLLKLQDQEQQHAVDLDTLTTTVYVVVFAGALLAYFVYAHRLQNRRAHNKVKMDRDMRRLDVLRTAHRRTLHAVMPDHIAHSLQNSCDSNVNNVNSLCGRTLHRQNNVPSSIQPKLLTVNDPGREQIPADVPLPLYHCGYRAIVVIFATIVQDPLSVTTTSRGGLNESSSYYYHRQLFQLHEIFSEFDKLLNNHRFRGLIEKIKMVGTNTCMIAVGLQHQLSSDSQLIMLLKDMKRRNDEFYHQNKQDKKYDVGSYISNGSVENDIANNRYELQDIVSANYIVFALDFIRDMRRVLHRWQTTTALIENSHNSQPMEFALRVGVNVGPAVAGLIGCKNGIWKRPLFDVWGNTVNVARQMDTTGVPGNTQVTDCVVNLIKALKDPKYEFDIRTKVTNKDNKRITYFVHEHFDTVDGHNLVEQQQNSSHLQKQTSIVHKNHHHQLELNRLPHNQPVPLRSSQNSQRSIKQHLKPDQSPSLSCNVVPIVTVHPQHSYFNAMVQQELRQKCMEPQKTPPPPPPRSPPSANIRLHAHPSVFQHQCSGERDQHPEQRQRSRGIHLSHDSQQSNYQPIRRTSNSTTKTEITYARPLQLQKHHQQNNTSLKSGSAPVPLGLSLIFGNDSQQPSSQYMSSITNVKSTSTPNHLITDETTQTAVTSINRQQQQQPCRPNKLSLVNMTTSTAAVTSKNFDADRPLPAPPRSSDTVAGRQRHHHDPRRRRRQHNQSSSTTKQQQEQNQQQVSLDTKNGPSLVPGSAAWPSSSSFRSPISVGSFVSVSSQPSSLSSSESTDAGDTTTSNNNYNTTTTASSSDESFGPTATEDCGGVDRVDTEDFDTAASSAAVSPIHHRYRQQQLFLRQWSPSNSSSVKRSSSFRSPLSACDASSSSLRSPLIAGHPTVTGNVGTQSLNRRKIHSTHSTPGAGNSSGRRRRRRQQQLQNNVTALVGQSTPPSNVAPDDIGVNNTVLVTTDKYISPPSSPWKKPLQRRQVMSKDQGTTGNVTSPDFTDEIRRILLLDHHRDDINNGKQIIGEDEVKQSLSSEQQQHRSAMVETTDWKSNKDDENHPLVVPTALIATKPDAITMPSASSSFEERERQITEQVKRQEAEVRRILQAHKNNIVAVARGVAAAVQTDVALHGRRKRAPPPPKSTVESSEWSDDESVEPSSLLDDGDLQEQRVSDYKADGSVTTADEGDGYTTGGGDGDGYTTGGGDGDGYTTGGGDGYTTDDAVDAGIAEDMVAADLSVISARQLDDNLSTMNDTGLTDAEGALSDVNSMIDYNDCDNRNRYGRRRQSSLSGSSVCPYASDSFCDDDDYLNDDDEFILHEGYDVDDEKLDVCNDDFGNSRQYNFNQHLQQQQRLSPPQPSLSSLPDDVYTHINKRLYSQQPRHQSSQYTAINATQKLNMSDTIEVESARTTTSDNTSFSTETDKTTKISKSEEPSPSPSSTINS